VTNDAQAVVWRAGPMLMGALAADDGLQVQWGGWMC